MDLGDNHNYNMHPRINGDPQRGNSNTVSLLDLPNSTIDDTSILTPTALNMDRHSHHTTLMDTQARNTSTSNNTPNSTTKLSTNYHQTRAARRAQQQQEIHNLDTGTTTSCKQTAYSSFDEEHDISKLFLASRNNTNNNQHQNLASSFDPSDKTCTICTTTHNILTPSNQAPLTLIISDQGFPGVLSGGTLSASKLSVSKTAPSQSWPTCSLRFFRVQSCPTAPFCSSDPSPACFSKEVAATYLTG